MSPGQGTTRDCVAQDGARGLQHAGLRAREGRQLVLVQQAQRGWHARVVGTGRRAAGHSTGREAVRARLDRRHVDPRVHVRRAEAVRCQTRRRRCVRVGTSLSTTTSARRRRRHDLAPAAAAAAHWRGNVDALVYAQGDHTAHQSHLLGWAHRDGPGAALHRVCDDAEPRSQGRRRGNVHSAVPDSVLPQLRGLGHARPRRLRKLPRPRVCRHAVWPVPFNVRLHTRTLPRL